MQDELIIIYAIPFFLLSVALEFVALRHAAHEHETDPDAPVGYDVKDSSTSMTMGLGHLFVAGAWKLVLLFVYAGIYTLSPLQLSASDWWVWVLLLFADDLAFYCYHRSHHRIRVFWATHVVHHSSEHFNFSTALRQDWSPFTGSMFWLPMAIFFPPWMIFVAMSWSLIYQFTLHTEAIDKYPRPIEWFWNTPSHHRVHHGSQEQYLDRNYGGILIIWDRMFGSFEPEAERVRYGLTKNIETYNPVRVAFGEFANIWRDVKAADTWRDRFSFAFKGPGWSPEPQPEDDEAAFWTGEFRRNWADRYARLDGGARTLLRTVSTFDVKEARDGMLKSGMESGVSEGNERMDELLARKPAETE